MKFKIGKKLLSIILSLGLILQIVAPVVYGQELEGNGETSTITAFEELDDEITNQNLMVGAEESDVILPDTLLVTVERGETIFKDIELKNIAWQIDEENSDSHIFDSSQAMSYSYLPVLQDMDYQENELRLSEDVILPSLYVNIVHEPEDNSYDDMDGDQSVIKTKKIIALTDLSKEIANQNLMVGANESDIILPDTLLATLEIEETTIKDFELKNITWESNKAFSSEGEDEFIFTAKLADDSYALADDIENPTIIVRIEKLAERAVCFQNSPEGTIKTITEFEKVYPGIYRENIRLAVGSSQETLLEILNINNKIIAIDENDMKIGDITWEIDLENSNQNTFVPSKAGGRYTYKPVLPNDSNGNPYKLIDGLQLPKTYVQVGNDFWVGDTQVIEGGILHKNNISGEGWQYESKTKTLTLNGANIKNGHEDSDNYHENGFINDEIRGVHGIFSEEDLNIVLEGEDSIIDVADVAGIGGGNLVGSGIRVKGNLSIRGSGKLSSAGKTYGIHLDGNLHTSGGVILDSTGTKEGINVDGNLELSDSTKIRGTGQNNMGDSYGVHILGSIKVLGTAVLTGHGKTGKQSTGVYCKTGNITIDSGATLIAFSDQGGKSNDSLSRGLSAGSSFLEKKGETRIYGTLVASAGDVAEKNSNSKGAYFSKTNLIVSGNGSVTVKSGKPGYGEGDRSYGIEVSDGDIIVEGGGFLASGHSNAVYPADTEINISGLPVLYELSKNIDGSDAEVYTNIDNAEWKIRKDEFGDYKYIKATKTYSDFTNGIQITRINSHDVLGDGTVSYIEASDGSPASVTLNGANFHGGVNLGGDAKIILNGASTIGSLSSVGNVSVSGSNNLTVSGDINCGDGSVDSTSRIVIENGASLISKGTIVANTLVNKGAFVNESTDPVTIANFDNSGSFTNAGSMKVTGDFTGEGNLVNEGTLIMPNSVSDTIAKSITGKGITEVKAGNESDPSIYYSNGEKLIAISHSLDFTKVADQGGWAEDGGLEDQGYQWNAQDKILTLKNIKVDVTSGSAISLPEYSTVILESVNFINSQDSYGILGSAGLTFEGIGYLKVSSTSTAIATSSTDDDLASINTKKGAMILIPNGGKTGFIDGTIAVILENNESTAAKEVVITKRYDQDNLVIKDIAKKTIGDPSFKLETSGGSGRGLVSFVSSDSNILSIDGDTATIHKAGTVSITATKAEDTTYNQISSAALSLVIASRPSTGGGSSGGSGSSTSTQEPIQEPTQATITITITKDTANVSVSQVAILDAIKKAKQEAKENGTEKDGIVVEIKIDTKNNKISNLSTNLPKSAVDELVKAGIKELYINSEVGTISLDLETLKTIQKQLGTDVNISMKKLDKTTLTGDAKALIGDRPVFDFSITGKDGQRVTKFGKGKISIGIPYILADGEQAENMAVYYIDSEGKISEMPDSVYNKEDETMSFTTDHFSKFAVGYKEVIGFIDISNHWAKEDIEFVTAKGLFSGTGEGIFSPDISMTRGMFVTVLGRLANVDTSKYNASKFTDVKSEAYYMTYVEWASENGIVDGVGNDNFAPNQAISREQMAVILYRYSQYKAYDTSQGGMAIREFEDYENISEYALDAMGWTVNTGLIQGSNMNIMPKESATRAQVATILNRFIQTIVK